MSGYGTVSTAVKEIEPTEATTETFQSDLSKCPIAFECSKAWWRINPTATETGMSVLMEFSIFPTDQGESVSDHVSEVIRMIKASGVDYRLTPMGTVIETEQLAEALAVVERAATILQERDCRRIYSTIKLDLRAGKSGRLEQKVRSVEQKIGEVRR